MCHVLVIEDEWFIAGHIVYLIAQAGATSIDHATTEASAVAAALARPPALITSDVQLADSTGPAAVQTIMEHLGPVPVIFVTAPRTIASRVTRRWWCSGSRSRRRCSRRHFAN